MLWLQTHFENDQWEALSNSTVIISEENSKLLIEDASNAGLDIKTFSNISMLDVFQKTINIKMFKSNHEENRGNHSSI